MRKKLIICLLIILILMLSILITLGLYNETIGVVSYVKLQEETAELNSTVQKLQEKNTTEYKIKKQALLSASNQYKQQKARYESVIPTIQAVGTNQNSTFDLYDIDFLWTIIGNYATEEEVVLQFDVSTSSDNIAFLSTDYILCDLNFTVSGEYLSIVNFIYNLEDDDRLNFEISDFALSKVEEELQATFIVKSAPINKMNLSNVVKNDITEEAIVDNY